MVKVFFCCLVIADRTMGMLVETLAYKATSTK